MLLRESAIGWTSECLAYYTRCEFQTRIFFLRIQINLCNIPSRLKPLHHLFTSIKLGARNILRFSGFTFSENTYSFLRVKLAYEDATVQKERWVLKIVVIAGLHPQSSLSFCTTTFSTSFTKTYGPPTSVTIL
jgi:hypothetical protein